MRDNAQQTWWAAGLHFECTRCGRCCTSSPDSEGYVWVDLDDAERIAAHLGLPLADLARRHLRLVGSRLALVERGGGECVFLRDGLCSVHEARPRQCAAFPFWPRNLTSPSAWAAAAAECEGIRDDAPVVARDEIERLRALFSNARREPATQGAAPAPPADAPRRG